ncbi:unnamed protein product [Cuscuta europaea]|uniref:MAR-binding filament-like protein 1-1 n=1 Tax=Cuscuta europaea TaxID=41803 RepID=A0A9P0Z7D0_CUSEU|nr:unnamed protein product [Cuscuta europaea]
MGSPCCLLQSPCHHSFFASSSFPLSYPHPSSLSPSPSSFFLAPRNAQNRRKLRPALALVRAETQNDRDFCNRRMIIFTGISVLPLFQLRARAIEVSLADSISETLELKAKDQEEEAERRTVEGNEFQNPLISLLNGIGFYGSGVLGALYALAKNENAKSIAALESMRGKLEEKEATIVSMGKMFESELLKEKEEQNKQQRRASEEHQILLNRLNSTNVTIKDLEQELLKEKEFVEDLKSTKRRLEGDLMIALEEKNKFEAELKNKLGSINILHEKMNFLSVEIKDKDDNLQKISTQLAEKEAEVSKLISMHQQSHTELLDLTSENKNLKDEILKKESELYLKNSEVDSQEVKLNSLIAERNELIEKHSAMINEYNDLKHTSENKAASNAKLLEEQKQKMQHLQKHLDIASDEMEKNKVLITDLTLEKVEMKKILDTELETAKELRHGLDIARENLENSRNETYDLKNQLEQSRELCSGLEAEASMLRSDIVKATETLHINSDEAKKVADLLASELTSTKELLGKAHEEVQIIIQELASVANSRDSLQKELVDVYKKAESAANDLREERCVVASLNKELQILETEVLRHKEERNKSLEADLEEAMKSLVEMNQNAMALSKELELAMTAVSRLEDEKQVLLKSLAEQRKASQEARDNMEDAHNLVMRLGKERENFERRAKKLEEELGSAKGELLRLRSQMNSSNTPVNVGEQVTGLDDKATISARRYVRKRKSSVPEQDDS